MDQTKGSTRRDPIVVFLFCFFVLFFVFFFVFFCVLGGWLHLESLLFLRVLCLVLLVSYLLIYFSLFFCFVVVVVVVVLLLLLLLLFVVVDPVIRIGWWIGCDLFGFSLFLFFFQKQNNKTTGDHVAFSLKDVAAEEDFKAGGGNCRFGDDDVGFFFFLVFFLSISFSLFLSSSFFLFFFLSWRRELSFW